MKKWEKKGGKRNKRCWGNRSRLPAGRPMPSQFLGKPWLTSLNPLLSALLWGVMVHSVEYLFPRFRSSAQLCHLPTSCAPPIYSLGAGGGGRVRNGKGWDAVQALVGNHKSKPQPPTTCGGETDPGQQVTKDVREGGLWSLPDEEVRCCSCRVVMCTQ